MDSCGLHEHQEVGCSCGCAGRLLVRCRRLWWNVAFKYRYSAVTQRWHTPWRRITHSNGMKFRNHTLSLVFKCFFYFSKFDSLELLRELSHVSQVYLLTCKSLLHNPSVLHLNSEASLLLSFWPTSVTCFNSAFYGDTDICSLRSQ